MRIDVFTIFPDLVDDFAGATLLGRARAAALLDLRTHDLRDGTTDAHRTVDDAPFGGGAGMVLAPRPVFAAVEAVDPPRPLILLGPAGRPFDQERAHELAASGGFSLLCGRYEGVDERIRAHLVDDEVSIGDYVLFGGEVAAAVVVEAVARLRPGVVGNEHSPVDESFTSGLLEYPHYTRPAQVRGRGVPAVLTSGDHGAVARWRRDEALARTQRQRPDLLGPTADEPRRSPPPDGGHPSGGRRAG